MEGDPLTLLGPELNVGEDAPDAVLVGNDLSEQKLSSFFGKTLIVSVVPSLDTGVCDRQTRRFNEEASALGEGVLVLTISTDLPFAQARWCGAAGVQRVRTLSDHREVAFGKAYGVLIKGLRLLARVIFVIDAGGKIAYIERVVELTNEPDYDAAVAAAKAAQNG